MQLSNAKLSFLRVNTTSIVQLLDHGGMHSFKCHYREMLVKRIITRCTTIYTVDQIMGTGFDAVRWIAVAWNNVADIIIRNCLRATGFSRALSNQQTFKNDVSSTDDGSSQDPIKQLDDLPSHVRIDGNQPSALELVNIDSSIPVCNEWNGKRNFLVEIVSIYHIEGDDGQQQVKETPPNLLEAFDMLQSLHLLASTEQSQLHLLISDLKSKVTDAYLDSKVSKQNCIPDCFNTN